MATMAVSLKIFKSAPILWIEPKLGRGAFGGHGDSELLKSFCSDIEDGHHSGHIEIVQTISPLEPEVGWS